MTAVLRTHPSDTEAGSADFFMRNFRNRTIDVGENSHADGVRWYGNNSSALKNVRVTGTGRVGINAGFLGQNGPSLVQDAEVFGKRPGFDGRSAHPGSHPFDGPGDTNSIRGHLTAVRAGRDDRMTG